MRVRGASGAGRAGGSGDLDIEPPALPALPALLFLLTACAKIAPPPGGPPDIKPPVVVATVPESTAVIPDFKGDVEFIFDETVSEGTVPDFGLGNGDLEKLVLLSPTSKQPVVRWHRGMISVRPKEGWQPNRVYRAELLPGVADLRRNVMKQGGVVTFTTGAPIPTATLAGTTIDWAGGRGAPRAVIEAVLAPDSLVYRSASDSTGRFSFGPLPSGSYLVYAYIDQNHDLKRAYREAWDSVRVTAGGDTTRIAPFWMAERDTTPPRMAPAQMLDSQSVLLGFNQPLDPYQRFDSIRVRLLSLPDSTPIAVVSLLPKAKDDSIRARAKALADSLRADSLAKAHPDTTRRKGAVAPPQPVPSLTSALSAFGARRPTVDSAMIKLVATRPPLSDKLVLRTAVPLKPNSKYFIELTGLRNVNHVGGKVAGGIQVPKPPPPPKQPAVDSSRADSTRKAPQDSTASRSDSLTAKLDSLKARRRALPRPTPADTTHP